MTMSEQTQLLLLSTSTVYGGGYLGYCESEIIRFFERKKNIVFIPFARPGGISHDEYTDIARKKFDDFGMGIKGLHQFDDKIRAIEQAEGVFTGGGNTFVLLNALYGHRIMWPLRKKVESGMPYMGTSAGSNVAGATIKTTNDMPIVYPPSFDALNFVHLNINPHYIEPAPGSKHMGETRETRIKEFHVFNALPVIGLREGSWLRVSGNELVLGGELKAKIFLQAQKPHEVEPGTNLSHLNQPPS
jgi:dipeptidase E